MKILVVAIVILMLLAETTDERKLKRIKKRKENIKYILIGDAGSTGTKLFYYKIDANNPTSKADK